MTRTRIVAATPADMPFIAACVRCFRLDDEDLRPEQFVVARDGDRILAFGRIKPYGAVHELGCVGVVEEERGRGLGRLIVRALVERFPTPQVYITTDLPAYFERLGFSADRRRAAGDHGEDRPRLRAPAERGDRDGPLPDRAVTVDATRRS